MNWNFWKRAGNGLSEEQKKKKLPGPKDLPQQVGQYLVVREKMDPDWVWHLKCVLRPNGDSDTVMDFRVFSPGRAKAAAVKVADFDSLDAHPELVLFEGCYDRRSNHLILEKRVA